MTDMNEKVKEISKQMAKQVDELALKALQDKFNTTETDPIKFKQMLDDANLDFYIEKVSEDITRTDENTYQVKTVHIPVFRERVTR